MNITKPVYQHDCERCIFLGNMSYSGRWVPEGIISVDLYVCLQRINGATFIARFGDEGSEYMSGFSTYWLFNREYDDYPLLEAMRRAFEHEIISVQLKKAITISVIATFKKKMVVIGLNSNAVTVV